jgi:S-adenosylmethionine:tRNA ribosyltransferase-isomerase
MAVDFALPPALEAHDPPETRGVPRDAVRLLVSRRSTGEISHHGFREFPGLLLPGDLLVVNNSGTLPAAVPLDEGLTVHFSTQLPDGTWLVELRRAFDHNGSGSTPTEIHLPAGAVLTLLSPVTTTSSTAASVSELRGRLAAEAQRASRPGESVTASNHRQAGGLGGVVFTPQKIRLWRARLSVAVLPYLRKHGTPIRYSYVTEPWDIESYQTVFARVPGSAEMPSASRPFTPAVVTDLVSRGVLIAPLTLHTGVSSLEADEDPYPEPFDVPPATARLVNLVRRSGGRVIAAGTTVVRALESAVSDSGLVVPTTGWTSHVVTPETGVRVVDGLLTGLHEPRSSHLRMLTAFAGQSLLSACYEQAIRSAYLWHEFGDVHLLLP